VPTNERRSGRRVERGSSRSGRGRTALDGAPGIPASEVADLDGALEAPDSDLAGPVAADTTPGGPTGDEPDGRKLAEEDRKRNTL
jgi:hypothetical protein